MHLLQNPQLVGYGALAEFHLIRNIRDALFLFRQQIQDVYPGGIRKTLEELSDKIHNFLFRNCHAGYHLPFFFYILP